MRALLIDVYFGREIDNNVITDRAPFSRYLVETVADLDRR